MINCFYRNRLVFILSLFISITSFSQVKLPKLISDGMILQRDTQVKIWGWSDKNEKITVRFIDSTYSTTADDNGKWNVLLSKHKQGGPFEMVINASNVITIHNIMIGDVWLCSGQSNMELPMRRVGPIYKSEIANSTNDFIRQFTVPQKYNFNMPLEDLESGSAAGTDEAGASRAGHACWKSADPETVLDFSAVAYFFAKELYDKYKVPIGLIHSSLGGSPAEAWISEESLKQFPVYYDEAQKFKDSLYIKSVEDGDNKRIHDWYVLLRQKDEGYKDPQKIWYDPNLNTSDLPTGSDEAGARRAGQAGWTTMNIPGYWVNTELGFVNGVVWFRKKINIPASFVGKPALLVLGRIVDADSVFINGTFVGTTSYQYPPRRYDIPPTLLKEGENTFVIRVINSAGKGGFVEDKPYKIFAGDDSLDLKGEWQFRLGAKMDWLASQTFIRWKPVGLYNAMISPLLNYRIKGAIWYQGESNTSTSRAFEYRKLLPAMISDWRKKWQQGDFPFLIVQLANFMEKKNQPSATNCKTATG